MTVVNTSWARSLCEFGLVIGFACASTSVVAQQSDDKSVWACQLSGASEEELFLVADGRASYVKLYEDRIWGSYARTEEGQRWDFGGSDRQRYQYSILLAESGKATFYDFGDAVSSQPDQTVEYRYQCRRAQ